MLEKMAPKKPKNSEALNLRRIRQECNLTLDQAAKKLGIHLSILSRTERGERKLDSVMIKNLCKLYNCNASDIFN